MAPENAKPIQNGQKDKVKCLNCKWRGTVEQLLGVDEEEDKSLWCPRCKTVGWVLD